MGEERLNSGSCCGILKKYKEIMGGKLWGNH